MNKTWIFTILGTGSVIALIFLVSNFNIEINVNSKGDKALAKQQVNSMHGGTGGDSMAGHHAAAKPADATLFNNLLGKPAPEFILETYGGKKISLSELKGKNVILFFNEGLMCYPACWNQIAAFGKDTELGKKAVVLNITVDPKNNWKQALEKMPELASATVLFDSDRQVSALYGVLTLPSSMHKGQFPGHSYVLINKEGIVKFIKDDVQMATRNQEMLAEIDKL